MLKKILCLTSATALVLSMALPVHSLDYEGSEAYSSGKYYQALTEVPLTGDQRADIVNIALSQVGYQEGGSSPLLSGEVYGGVNFTEYGAWYGMQDMWCAMFASWCAHVADIPTDVIPSHSYTPNGLKWFRDRGLAHEQSEIADGTYTPRPGDLIYFRSTRNENTTNHVGIVTGCEGGMIYTVEGNIGSPATYSNGGMVTTVTYPITNSYIVAVCSPNYTTGAASVQDPMVTLRQAIQKAEGSGYDQIHTSYGTVTLGIGQWYGTQAQALLRAIREADEAAFAALDTAAIAQDLDQADWSAYLPDADKTACIRRILSSEQGIRAQDRLLTDQLQAHLTTAQEKGITDLETQTLYALLCHLLGPTTADRLISTPLQSTPYAYLADLL
ncbi:MAG: CHAP domain-containing protein [Oscillospiraceae bacterium]|nr:CHAP domain-containing protein [Oscillospiraceae bacterium]